MAYRQSRRSDRPSPVTVLTTVAAALIAGRPSAARYTQPETSERWPACTASRASSTSGRWFSVTASLRAGRSSPSSRGSRGVDMSRVPSRRATEARFSVPAWASRTAPPYFGPPSSPIRPHSCSVSLPGTPIPFPSTTGEFYALLLFGAVFGAWYPLLRSFFDERR